MVETFKGAAEGRGAFQGEDGSAGRRAEAEGPSIPNEPQWVGDAAALGALIERLAREPTIALDSEADSFHVYFEKVCLIQIGVPGEAYLVDPLAVDVRPLAPTLADPAHLWVVHGGDFDVRSLRRDFGFQFGRLFDSMLAAQALRLPELGLAALLRSRLGVTIMKGEQRSDWGRRPLRAEQRRYAAADVHHLLRLERDLSAALDVANRRKVAELSFEKLRHLVAREKRFDEKGYLKLRGARAFGARELELLRELWVGREALARELDRPPFKVVGEQSMVEIARLLPQDREALRRIPGVSDLLVRRLGEAILRAATAPKV